MHKNNKRAKLLSIVSSKFSLLVPPLAVIPSRGFEMWSNPPMLRQIWTAPINNVYSLVESATTTVSS